MRFLWMIVFICLPVHWINAQWTAQDSLWLKNVLEGKDTIRLNPEFQHSIESGTFLNDGKPIEKSLMLAPNPYPLLKDFSEYIQHEDSSKRRIPFKDLPPQIFWRHVLPLVEILPVYQSILDELKLKPCVGQPASGMISFGFDAAGLTSRKEFIHKRNAKRDSTWRNYNNLPSLYMLEKQRKFLEAHPEKRIFGK